MTASASRRDRRIMRHRLEAWRARGPTPTYAELDELGRELVDKVVVEATTLTTDRAKQEELILATFAVSLAKLARRPGGTGEEIKALDARLGGYARAALARLAEVAATGGATAGRA